MAGLELRFAAVADVPVLLELIRELAAFERLADQVHATEALLAEELFGARRVAEAAIAELDGNQSLSPCFSTTFRLFWAVQGFTSRTCT